MEVGYYATLTDRLSFDSKTPHALHIQPFLLLRIQHLISSERSWLIFIHSIATVGSVECHCVCYLSVVLRPGFAGAPTMLAKKQKTEQISNQHRPSFWMNDLRSRLPGSLHQTMPTLIINDSGGQCPIFKAESSVMPGQTKPPEFHHFQLLLTPK